jgi:hypothetical protein
MEYHSTMSQFKYTLPSGAEFVVNGPAGATQAEADKIFYEQVASGSLVGYRPGQTLTSPATQITKFELSRLDRGTAGVDTNPILAISQGLPVVSGSLSTPSILAAIQSLPIPVGIPNLSNVPLTSPIDEADVVLIKGDNLAPNSIGANGITALSEFQVQKLLAQIAALVNQSSDQITQDKGLGQFGFTAYALEQAGYVKPGTSLRFFSQDPEDFVTVMSSPSVWTGKDGIYSLNDLLSDPVLQNRIQVQLMQQGYDGLLSSGTIVTVPKPSVSLSTGQVYTNSGLQSARALTAASLLGAGAGSLSGILQNALTASTSLNRLLSGANINLATIGSGATNSLTAGLGNLGNLANVNFSSLTTNLTNQITGGVGALVTNASKFGAQATELWAKSGNLSFESVGTDLSKFAGPNLNNLTAGFTGSFNSISSQLTNLVPGSLSNLTSNLDVFGKAGSFATNFANPLGNLNNLGSLGSLQGALTGQLGSLQGVLGNLGGFANIGAVGDLFGGGGDLVSGTSVAGGFNNTVNRSTLDAAFARVVGSSKIPLPTFQYPSLAALAPRLDIQQAQNFLKNLQSPGSNNVFGQTATV